MNHIKEEKNDKYITKKYKLKQILIGKFNRLWHGNVQNYSNRNSRNQGFCSNQPTLQTANGVK